MSQHIGETPPDPRGVESGGQDESDVSRRRLLRFAVDAVPVAAALAANGYGYLQDSPEVPNLPHESPPDGAAEHGEGEHVVTEITTKNFFTAAAVTGTLLTQVGKNAAELAAFGPQSVGWVWLAEGPRLGILASSLNESDRVQASHEVHEIFGVSYPIAAALTLLSEATAHVEVDEEVMFGKVDRELMAKIDEGFEAEFAERSAMPAVDASAEEWREFAASAESTIKKIHAQNYAFSDLALAATTYLTAEQSNNMNKRMTGALVDYEHAKAVLSAKESGSAVDEMSCVSVAIEKATKLSKSYSELMLLVAADIAGVGFIGDPPLPFYATRNGAGEWVQASVQGAATMKAISAVQSTLWLRKALGNEKLSETSWWAATGEAYKGIFDEAIVKAGGRVAGGVYDATLGRLISGERQGNKHKKIAAELHKILAEREPGDGLSAEALSAARGLLGNVERYGIAFDSQGMAQSIREQAQIIAGKFMGRSSREGQEAARDLHANIKGGDGSSVEGAIQRLFEQSGAGNKKFVSSLLKEFGAQETDWRVEQAANMFDAIIAGEEPGDIASVMGVRPSTEANSGTAEYEKRLAEALRSNNQEQVSIILDEFLAQYPTVPGDVRRSLAMHIGRKIGSDEIKQHATHEDGGSEANASSHANEKGFSHAAKEVFWALATQIPAASAAAVVAKKALEGLGDGGFAVKKGTVMAMTAALSAVADNVVAYLFAEDVLLDMYKKEFGDTVFEENPALKDQVTRSALYCAVAGGALSKIGNGPNFKMDYFELTYDKGTRLYSVVNKERKLRQSLANKWAASATASVIALSMLGTSALEPDKDRQKAEPKAESPQSVGIAHGASRRDAIVGALASLI